MIKTRVIPILLLKSQGFVKTKQFKNPTYLGCPINIVKIFNDKEVDELVVLDILAGKDNRIQFDYIKQLASECFMPLTYGGGVKSVADMKTLYNIGIEKVAINSSFIENPNLISEAANIFGSQSVVVSIDVKKSLLGKHHAYTQGGKKKVSPSPIELAVLAEKQGAGELLISSIDREGSYKGYDISILKDIANAVNIPVIINGGANSVADFKRAVDDGGAHAVAAGSMFVFHGKHRAVLINFPKID